MSAKWPSVSAHDEAERLSQRYRTSGDVNALRGAAHEYMRAASMGGERRRLCYDLKEASGTAWELYETEPELWALDQAISAGRAAAGMVREPLTWIAVVTVVGAALRAKYEVTGERPLLQESITALRSACAALPAGSPEPAVIQHLVVALRLAYKDCGAVDLLVEAVGWGRVAAGVPDRLQIDALLRLAGNLSLLSDKMGDIAPLGEARRAAGQAVRLATTRAERSECLAHLSNTLRHLFMVTGDIGALREAVRTRTEAISLCDHPGKRSVHVMTLSGLHKSLREQTE
ncbi:hypothetical protein J5X84_41295 [Streptosporangiaceae bacterium NEAU-GS5]|nr:hypothetical protein [Streptosporangiaceae bacterium NEAU-GS5]